METRGMAQQETETDFSPIPIVIAHCLLWSRSRVYKDRVTGQTFQGLEAPSHLSLQGGS